MTIEEHMARAMCKASGRDPDKIVPPPRGRTEPIQNWNNWAHMAEAAYAAALPLIAAELAGVARDPKLIDQVSRGLAAGWRGNPNMSGDDRDFMHPSMRRRHDEKSADACEFIALAIEAHARKMGEA